MVQGDIKKNDLNSFVKRVQEHMERFVEHAEPNLMLAAIMGGFGFPLYYFVLHDFYPQSYENLPLRLLNSVVCFSWGAYRFMPDWIKRFFPVYFIISVLYIIPYYFSFMLLKNEFSTVWVMSTMGGLILMTLLVYDWKYLCGMIVSGYGLAWMTVFFIDGKVSYTYFREVYIFVYMFSVMGSIIATHKRQTINRIRMVFMRSLSGTIAHEMRNPLNAIVNAIEAIQSILPERPSASSREEIFMISRNSLEAVNDVIDEASDIVRRGNKIIDSILTAMQGGEVDIKSFRRRSATTTIHSAIDTFAYSAPEEKKLIHIDTREDFEFFGDKDLLVYVLFNLIKNALYYKNKPSFSIAITTESHPSGNFIRVRDTGPGVPVGKRELIFESFYTHGKTGGNGLGLSFCRRVINSFGGHIVCHSKEQEWTEFEIMLPVYHSDKVLQLKKDILKKKQVLLVDDESSQRQLLMNLFLEWNCKPDEAASGEAAIKMASYKAYDLILMDIDMPGKTGYETAETLRSGNGLPANLSQHYREIPLLGLNEQSVTTHVHHHGHGRKHTCVGRLYSKPIEKKILEEIFEQFFFTETAQGKQLHAVDLSGTRILIADDNATNRKFLRVVLEHSGCRVFEAEHGLEAIDKLEQADIDIVLMDIEMPVMGGIDAVRLIRGGSVFHRFRRYREVPIIALTGHTDQDSVDGIMRSGVNAHLSKPVAKKELIATLSFWLQRNSGIPGEVQGCEEIAAKDKEAKAGYLDSETLEMLMETLGREGIAELFDIFRTDTEKLLEKIDEAVQTQENRDVAYLAHTLKGSAGTIGAIALSVNAGKLYAQLKSGRHSSIDDEIKELREIYSKTQEQLDAYKMMHFPQSV
ncbi:MAG: response regulator [Chlorobiaceae bacterium]|nr:response regulator [Chlorobiaceae bacterium]NTW10161.1 response regulator [Chlorobiaceae bacterium]